MWNSVKKSNPSRSVFESCMFVNDFMPTEYRRERGQYKERAWVRDCVEILSLF